MPTARLRACTRRVRRSSGARCAVHSTDPYASRASSSSSIPSADCGNRAACPTPSSTSLRTAASEAVIVRVVNGARSATFSLRAGKEFLTLQAASPGTREFLRTSVDYDNIPPHDELRFNLTVQRVRVQGGSHIEDQEIFPQLSVLPGHERYVGDVLLRSELIRVLGPVPALRPERTLDGVGNAAYVSSNSDGDDGAAVDRLRFDRLGARAHRLVRSRGCDYFNLLCVPPLARTEDVGPAVLDGGGALLQGARCDAHRRSALRVAHGRRRARGHARVGRQVGECAHVFPAHPRARQAARSLRVVRALRRGRRHSRAQRRDASGMGRAAYRRCRAAARLPAGVPGAGGSPRAAACCAA